MDNPNDVLVSESDIAFDKLFRSSLGGFNKDDVINYLERMARNRRKESERYAAHIRKLEAEIEELRSSRDGDVRTDLPMDTSRLSVLESENAALRSEIEVLRLQSGECEACSNAAKPDEAVSDDVSADEAVPCEEASVIPVQPSQEQSDDADLAAELEAQRSKCAALEEKLRAYELEKLHLSEIEDAAHRNAEKIEADARERAAQTVRSVAQRVEAMQQLLCEVSAGIDDTTRAIYSELSQCGIRYAALRRSADDLRAELNNLHLD